MNELIFTNPANAHSTIGSMEDLDAATIDDVQQFFRVYYAPNNAVLSVVGDFDRQEARELIEQYFGSIAAQPVPPSVDVSETDSVARDKRLITISWRPLLPLYSVGKYLSVARRSSMLCPWLGRCFLMGTVLVFTKNWLRVTNP